MTKKVDFLGLGMQSGQELNGSMFAPDSYRHFLERFTHLNSDFTDHGTVRTRHSKVQKLNSKSEVENFDFDFYCEAFHKLLKIYEKQNLILNWGGDHSVALSTVASFTYHYAQGYVLWIDAHADLNLPDYSLSKNLHGMPVSFLMNLESIASNKLFWHKNYLDPQKLIYVGLRDLDPFEVETLELLKIKYYTAEHVRRIGIQMVSQEIKEIVGEAALHISFDIDSLEPRFAPATGLSVKGGLTRTDVTYLGSALSSCHLKSVDVVEINPCIGSVEDVFVTNMSAHLFIESLRSNNKFIFQGGNNVEFFRANQKHDAAPMEPCP